MNIVLNTKLPVEEVIKKVFGVELKDGEKSFAKEYKDTVRLGISGFNNKTRITLYQRDTASNTWKFGVALEHIKEQCGKENLEEKTF